MRFKYSLVCVSVLAAMHANVSFANFLNGGFDAFNTTPSPAASITAWTSTGYLFTGYKAGLVLPPKSLDDIILESTSPLALGITDIVTGTQQTLYDYFLNGASPTTTLKLPITGSNTAMINLRSVNPTKSVSGTSGKPSGWSKYAKQATSLSQTITIQAGDRSSDGNVHIKFKVAPVMENPAHTAKQQPFYAIQINNLTTGRTGSNPLYFQWSYAAQPGVPWKTLTAGGSNSGSNATYTYTDVQTYDLSFSQTDIRNEDQVQLIVLAAGCSPGGHDGHIYIDDVTTGASTSPSSPSISISASTQSTSVTPGGQICYRYKFNYSGINDSIALKIVANMPLTQNTSPPYSTIYANDGTGNTPVPKNSGGTTIGSCTFSSITNALTCNINNNLGPLVDSYFDMCVNVPSDWQPSYGPINNGNYPISSSTLSPVLGNLVQTPIIAGTPPAQFSNLVVDPTGLLMNGKNPSLNNGDNYPNTHYYTCTNANPTATADAPNATCNISNLPPGFNVTTCTITSSGGTVAAWTQPQAIPINSTVKCFVSGIADSQISREWDAVITSDATNNTNTTQNTATVPFYIYNNPADIPATQNGSSVLTPIDICCGRPVMLYDLPIDSDLAATYKVIATTGNNRCIIGQSGTGNFFVKVFGRPGTCTIQGEKDGQISAPLTLNAQ